MAVNPAIALGVKGIELQDPLAQYGRIAAIQQAQQQNALAQLQMRQVEREQETTNALNAAYRDAYNPQTGDVDINRLRQSLATSGYGSKLPDLEKKFGELKTQRLTQQKTEGEIQGQALTHQKTEADIAATRMKQARDLLPSVNSPEAYANWRSYTLQNLPGLVNVIPEQYSPEAVLGLMLEADKALEQHFVSQNLGGTTRVVAMPKYGQGPARTIEGTEARMTMTPGEEKRLENEATRIKQEGQRLGLEGRRVAVLEDRAKDAGVPGMQLSKKELQSREAAFPKATTAIKSFEADANELISDLERLKNHPGLSNITGVIAGRTPSLTAQGRAAQALYDKIIAKGGFQSLQDVRNASPTGGALGSISNQEGQQLKSAFSEIDQKMDAPDVRRALDRTIQKVQGSKNRVREGYDLTYEYRAPAAPAAGGVKFLGFE